VNEQCYYRLKIDTTDALNPSWSMPIPKNNYGIWAPKAENIFSKTWLEYTAGLGIDFKHALLFYRGPNTTSREAHVDTHADDHSFVNFAVNWVIGGANSKMNWYKMPPDGAATIVKDNTSDVPYTTFQFKDLEYIESCKIVNEVTLVRTNLPHSITMGSEPRWCISARVGKDKDTSWDDIVEQFRAKNLLVERI
jgi:hypothetical protein